MLENRSRMITWWLAWLLLGAGQSLLLYKAYGGEAAISIAEGCISMIVYPVLALAAWYPIKFFNSNSRNMVTLLANLLATAVIMTGLWLLITRAIMSALFQNGSGYNVFWNATLSYRLGSGILICILVILTYYLIISYKTISDKKLDESRLENMLRETELRMLRSQINPHFLFNSLNSVSALTISNPEKAREMVIRLSDFMRYALSRKDEQLVPLRSELENLRLYLEIEKTRFGERLQTEEELPDGCLDIRIPNMLLQPLYENAVKFGLHESMGTVVISTMVECDETTAAISISNNFDTDAHLPSGTGTGLTNVKRRLELIYGREATLNTRKEQGLFTVELKIPVNHNQTNG